MKLPIFFLAALIACAAKGSYTLGEEIPAWKPKEILASVPVSTTGEPLIVPVTVNGRRWNFLLDTGSSTCAISGSPLPFDSDGADRTIPVEAFSFAGIDCSWVKSLQRLDLSFAEPKLGMKVDGIVGMNVLCKFTIHLDFDNGKMHILDGDRETVPPGSCIPTTFDSHGRPYVPLSLPGVDRRLSFLIDTGLMGCLRLDGDSFDDASKLPGGVMTGTFANTTNVKGTTTRRPLIRYQSVELEAFTVKDVVFSSGSYPMMGLPYLHRYRVTLDFQRGKSYWLPGNKFADYDCGDLCGIDCQAFPGTGWKIVSVPEGSLAARAGVRKDDEIVEVDGISTSKESDPKWMRILEFPSRKPIVLKVKRGNGFVVLKISKNVP